MVVSRSPRMPCVNDNRVVEVHLVNRIDAPLGPHIEVEVEVIETWDFDAEYVYLG